MTRDLFEARMVAWINARYGRPGAPAIAADSALFAERIIDSIRILELIAWTERAIGREIPDAEIRMDNFRSVARIAEVFAREEEGGMSSGDRRQPSQPPSEPVAACIDDVAVEQGAE